MSLALLLYSFLKLVVFRAIWLALPSATNQSAFWKNNTQYEFLDTDKMGGLEYSQFFEDDFDFEGIDKL